MLLSIIRISPVLKEEYSVEHVGIGWYNVVSPGGKVMNDKKLRSEDAKALKTRLEEEQNE